MSIRKSSFVFAFVAVLAFAGSASAQDKSSWGVSFDATPHWEYMSIMDKFIDGGRRLEGREIRVGILPRGRIQGGDWGVSVIRGEVNSSSFRKERTGESRGCQTSSTGSGVITSQICNTVVRDTEHYLSDISLLGVEIHKYVPFVTIAKRVQIGMNFGGGAMWARGTAEKHVVTTQTTDDNGKISVSQSKTVETVSFKEVSKRILGFSTIPTGRIEAVVGVIATDRFKVKVSGGLN